MANQVHYKLKEGTDATIGKKLIRRLTDNRARCSACHGGLRAANGSPGDTNCATPRSASSAHGTISCWSYGNLGRRETNSSRSSGHT